MRSSLIGGVALGALLALGTAATAQAQDAPVQPDAPVAQMTPEQMQAQIDEMQQELQFVKQVQAEQVAGVQNQLGGSSIKWDGSDRVTDTEGNAFKVRGRIIFDGIGENIDRKNGVPNYQSRNIRGRQMFLGVEGNIGTKFAYKLEGGWVNGGFPSWDDAVIEYKINPTTSILFGNQKAVSLENITSTRFTTFLDRGPYNQLIDADYHLGVGAVMTGPKYAIWGAVLGNSLNGNDVVAGAYGSTNANERTEVELRGVYQPILTDDDKLHLGGWIRYRNHGGENGFNYFGRFNTNFGPQNPQGQQLLNTGPVGNNDTTYSVEAAYIHQSYSVQGEFSYIDVDRLSTARTAQYGGSGFGIYGGYAFAQWFLTGETRNYNPNGQFGRTKILNPVDKGGFGAFEVAARYDYVDLTDLKANGVAPLATQVGSTTNLVSGAVTNGIATAGHYEGGTLGFNWYPIAYVRFMLNYTAGKLDNHRFTFNTVNAAGQITGSTFVKNDAAVQVIQLRAQLDF